MIPNKLGPAVRLLVVAVAAAGWTPSRAAGALPVQSGVPSAPQNVLATVVNSSTIEITWDPPASGSPFTSYQIEVSEDGHPFQGLGWREVSEERRIRDPNVPAGTTTQYRVRARNDVGFGPWAVATRRSATGPPSAPQSLKATTVGSTVTLTWSAPESDGGSSILSYQVHVSINNSSTWTHLTSGNASLTYTDVTATPGTLRRYRVRAVNSSGAGAPAYMTTGTAGKPTAPRNLTAATAGPSAIDLDWDAPALTGGSVILRYEIHVLVSNIWSLVATTTAAVTAYRDTRAPAGTARRYRVQAVNSSGAGAPAYVDAPAVARPGPPRNIEARARGSSEIELTWDARCPTAAARSPATGSRCWPRERPGGRLCRTPGGPPPATVTPTFPGAPPTATRWRRST